MFGVQLPKRFPKRFAIGAVVLLAAGGAAAATVAPALATSAPSNASPSTTSPSTHPPSGQAHGTKGHRHPLVAGLVRATAKETGLTAATVRQDLKAGQTFNAIAGGNASAVENDVVNALQARLNKAVTMGTITKQQASDLLAKAKTRLEKLMSTDLSKHTAAPAA